MNKACLTLKKHSLPAVTIPQTGRDFTECSHHRAVTERARNCAHVVRMVSKRRQNQRGWSTHGTPRCQGKGSGLYPEGHETWAQSNERSCLS